MSKVALITGISGMDGSHLADLLLEKDYIVHGIIRRCSRPVTSRIDHILDKIVLHDGDLLDQGSLNEIVSKVQPHEIYNLAAQSFVATSWSQPVLTSEVTGLGALRMLEACRSCAPKAKFYQASSSEMFGNHLSAQHEKTPFKPRSPYGVAKLFAHQMAINYRESYDMFVACGILFNHESERRGLEFVTRKITRQVAEVKLGLRNVIELGNTAAKRDWGYAPDYVKAMWQMLQIDRPDDYVIATGISHSVQEFLDAACLAADIHKIKLYKNPSLFRPAELHTLLGYPNKANKELDWEAETTFEEMVARMVVNDIKELSL